MLTAKLKLFLELKSFYSEYIRMNEWFQEWMLKDGLKLYEKIFHAFQMMWTIIKDWYASIHI